MTSPAPPDAVLLAAYAGTVWHVHGAGGDLTLHLDQPFAHPHLLPCAIITAYNPRSYPCEPSWNRAASERLHATIIERHRVPVPTTARGTDDEAGSWTEPGFLVSGIALTEAVAIAERFRQNAIVWVPADGRPVLVATRTGFLGLAPGDHIPIP